MGVKRKDMATFGTKKVITLVTMPSHIATAARLAPSFPIWSPGEKTPC